MKILTFAASNSTKSINKALLQYAASLLKNHEVEMLDINDFSLPIYSADLEEAQGVPEAAFDFLSRIKQADALLIAYAEHNGNYTAAYKNLFDWASRADMAVYAEKPIVMLSTSPGKNGANTVLAMAKNTAHFFKGQVLASLAIPSFYETFDQTSMTINDEEWRAKLIEVLEAFDAS
ncbi:NADPH-dependent oxidoreductase [Marinomonas agarivorans]|nr:NADPH-dependent oxidoreductase [Marinomonas agarivorans]